jgi:sorting nexin-1/2
VTDPIVKDGVPSYIVYTVKGIDKRGPFDGLRRYKDFAALRVSLVSRWPGCNIPPIPPKKAVVRITKHRRAIWMRSLLRRGDSF